MKNKLIEAYNELMKVPVSGMAIEPMYKGLFILAELINALPDETETKEEQNK